MKAPKPKSTAPKILVPAGTHLGVLYSIIDLGTQITEYNGEKKPKRRIRLTWELPKKRAEFDGKSKPLVVSKEMGFSMFSVAALRKVTEAIIGKSLSDQEANDFDVAKLAGCGCLVSIAYAKGKDGNTYAGISGIAPLMDGMESPAPENDVVVFDLNGDSQAVEKAFAAFPGWLQEKIAKSPEGASLSSTSAVDEIEHTWDA
jgi:hypothetical protein